VRLVRLLAALARSVRLLQPQVPLSGWAWSVPLLWPRQSSPPPRLPYRNRRDARNRREYKRMHLQYKRMHLPVPADDPAGEGCETSN